MRLSVIISVALLLLGFPGRACTCFVLDTPGGPVFGSNLDLYFPGDGLIFVNRRGIAKEGFQPAANGEVAKWVSRYGSVTFNLAGREMAFGGMNEAGLVVGSMELVGSQYPEPDERPGLTIGLWAQYVLDTCQTVDEAVAVRNLVRLEDSATPIHFLIADATGRCATVEWFDGEFTFRVGEDVPVKAMSNMPYDRALAALEMGGPRWWWSNPGASAERFAVAHQRNATYDAAKDPNAVDYAFGTLVHGVVAPHTRWSIVYDIARREIWYGTRQSRAVKHIAFDKLDFACAAPLLMLDVNIPLEGDIEDAFKPYDHGTNLAVFLTLCARYGIEISEKDATGIVRHLETFTCAPGEASAQATGEGD